jgi:hypothetical protein
MESKIRVILVLPSTILCRNVDLVIFLFDLWVNRFICLHMTGGRGVVGTIHTSTRCFLTSSRF